MTSKSFCLDENYLLRLLRKYVGRCLSTHRYLEYFTAVVGRK